MYGDLEIIEVYLICGLVIVYNPYDVKYGKKR